MPEGVSGYPRWMGTLSDQPTWIVIAGQEVRKTWLNFWGRTVILLAFGWALVSIANLFTIAQSRPSFHSADQYFTFLDTMLWGSLVVAGLMGGPALMEDARKGALELYLSRAVTTRDYLTGKVVAVFGLAALVFIGPAVMYWAGAFAVVPEQPEGWETIVLPAIAYGLIWAAVVSGLALGVSSVARSGRGAMLLFLGGFAIADLLVSQLFTAVTNSDAAMLLSPFADLQQQRGWLFGVDPPHAFPDWWGAAVLVVLMVVGWGLLAWRHPRIRGEE